MILNISTGSEVIEKRRAPSAALLPLALGVAALGSMVLSIQEVHDIYIMSEGEKRNNAALNLAQTEGGFLLLGALLGPAVVGGKAAYKVGSKIFSKFKKVFNPSFNIVSSARKLGKTTKEALSKFVSDIKLIAGNQVGAVGSGVDDLVRAAGKSTKPVENMSEFFSGNFGSVLKNSSSKISRSIQGQSVFKVSDKIPGFKKLRRGDHFYLDGMHKNHLEVFDKKGNIRRVLNLDGTINIEKTASTIKEGRRIKL